MTDDTTTSSGAGMDRRTVLAAAGAVGAAGVLAACSSSNPAPASSPAAPAPSGGAASGGTKGGQAIAQTSDIPVGGGKVLDDKMVVVTQPKAGEFKAFTSICPHQGCTVNEVTADTIVCPCHGSEFSAADR